MRFENDVPTEKAQACYELMLVNHGLRPYASDPMRGTASLTGAKYRAQFIEAEA